jgi:hypothetical protein
LLYISHCILFNFFAMSFCTLAHSYSTLLPNFSASDSTPHFLGISNLLVAFVFFVLIIFFSPRCFCVTSHAFEKKKATKKTEVDIYLYTHTERRRHHGDEENRNGKFYEHEKRSRDFFHRMRLYIVFFPPLCFYFILVGFLIFN